METLAVALGMALISQATQREITFSNGVFTVNGPEGRTNVRINQFGPIDPTGNRAAWRLADKDVVWDQRGLTISFPGYEETATYPSVPVNPRFFTAEQIAEHRRLIASGDRTQRANSLSGWATRGTKLYLLLRWDTNAGTPWLEALVEYDMTQADPAAKILGRFRGLSTAKGRVNDRLSLRGDSLTAITRTADASGIAQFDLRTNESRFLPLPGRVEDGRMIPGSNFGFTFTPQPAGSVRVGLIDMRDLSTREAAEIRGPIQGVIAPSILRYRREGRSILLNVDTGAELDLPSDSGVGAAGNGVLVWVPQGNPTAAALYTNEQFRTMARWTRPAQTTPAPSRPTTRPPATRPGTTPAKPAATPAKPASKPRTTPPPRRSGGRTNP